MFPGVYHRSGGEGPSHWDMVTPISDWVDRGIAPTRVIATQYEGDLTTAGGGFENPTQVVAPPTGAPTGALQPTPSTATTPAQPQPPAGAAGGAPTGRVVRTLPHLPLPAAAALHGRRRHGPGAELRAGPPAVSTRDDLDWLGKGLVSGYSK